MMDDPRAPAPIASAAADGPAFLGASQHEAANAIRRAIAERHVFVAVTGAPGLGKTLVLSTVGAAPSGPPLRVVRIGQPDQVSGEQNAQISGLPGHPDAMPGSCHTVLVVDDADRAPSTLLRALTRFADSPSSQVILAGRPELWDRIAADEFAPLRERITVRPVLRPMSDEDARALIRHLLNEPRKIFGQAFADDAEREVLGLAEGRPTRIGALVRSTLMLGDLQVRPQLSVEMVRATADMLDGRQQPGGKRRIGVLRPALAAALALAVGGLVVAARDGQLDPVLSALRGAGAVAGWMRPAGSGPAVLAGAPGTMPAERLDAGTPPGPAPDVPPAAPVQTAAPASMPPAAAPAASPPEPAAAPAAEAEAEHGLEAESQPPQVTEPAPQAELPAPVLSEQEAPAAAASAAPVPDSLPEAGRAPDTSAASDPASAVEAPASQPDAPAVEAAAPPQAVPEPAPAQAPEVAASEPSPGPTVPASPERSPATPAPDVVATLLRRGDEMLARGDVSTARQFYERALSSGSTLGACSLARTYDPAVLGRGSPAADPDAAAAWYDRAARLGNSEASARPSRRAAR